ncbi:MAG: Unknown protein [uncultured Sulfurovum sp.]|uniref:Uncharacterized protein n=1 Tax=uncultured Sulfurovum sp. TaxID=269237 RepID=A0A6S6T6R2_9BACT|nr:MAG: Unknown protein [uncultured Sulfurovum sp.]
MQGKIMVTYSLICDNDNYLEVSMKEILENEKIVKLLKSEFLKGVRNLNVESSSNDTKIILSTQKELYTFEADKKDFADLIELAEEDAKERKLFKKGCEAINLIDFVTL